MGKYWKAALMVVATVLSAVVAAMLGDNNVSPTEWVNVAILGVGSASVFAAPNVPGAEFTKTVIAVLTAVLAVLASAIVGGVTNVEWMQIALAGLGAVGVFAKANEGQYWGKRPRKAVV